MTPALAALDLGTNNCRLLVARARAGDFEVIDSFSRIVRLGEGLAASGWLRERAMARTIAALRVCARIMARQRVQD
ncbi:MAG: Ppx/GppA family phosphatase, partial [Geminicoccaceae bacterium]